MVELEFPFTHQKLFLVIAIFFLAGIIKGTIGVGLPTTAVTLMVQLIEPKIALAIAVFPIVVTNLQQFATAKNIKKVVSNFHIMALMIFISLGVTTFFTARLESDQIRFVTGFAICMFSITFLAWPAFSLPQNMDWFFQVILGLLSGIMGGLTSIWAPPIIIYLIGRQVKKDTFISATGFLFSVGSIPLLGGFIMNGMLTMELGNFSILCVIPSLLGFRLGVSFRDHISGSYFRKLVLIAFLLAGIRIILVS